ncbi:MAG TPA: putative manganese-dependent inorganic diphosphatase [Verrucomicrobiae bacterium]|nr:putative manganese-dependent inorganic diphosphatase [Verrucomicrobiae bacterium]
MNEIFVIGHRNPDTDAICSAIGYAEFKRRTGMTEAVAARCGDTNDRIDFVLETFGVPAPRFVADVSPRVADVMQKRVFSVTPDATAAEALSLMDEHNIRILPVLNDQRKCRGLLSLFKLSKFLFPAANRLIDSRRVWSSLENLAKTLGGKIFCGHELSREEDLDMMIGAMKLESFQERLQRYAAEKLVVVVGDRWDIQQLAVREGVRVLIVTGGLAVDERVIKDAEQSGVTVISSPHDTSTTTALCRAAVAIRHMINEEFLSFRDDASLNAVQKQAASSGYAAFPVTDEEGRVIGVLSKTDFIKPVARRLILVDHNELSQAVHGADEVEILEILDHHRIGTLTTPQPILFRNEPVGSTSTIVAGEFLRNHVEMPRPIAGLLLAGLVSDTLNLTSPTTTARDKEILSRLEEISGVNAREFTEKLFASGSLLTLKPAPQAIATDCKEYREDGESFSVAQIEEIGFEQFWKRKDELHVALENYRAAKNFLFSALLVTDVVRQHSLMLVAGAKKFVDKVDYPEPQPGVFELGNVVSRKKQLLPYLTHCLQRMKVG